MSLLLLLKGPTTHEAASKLNGLSTTLISSAVERPAASTIAGTGATVPAASIDRGAATTLAGVGAGDLKAVMDAAAISTLLGQGAITPLGGFDIPAASYLEGFGRVVTDGSVGKFADVTFLKGVGEVRVSGALEHAAASIVGGTSDFLPSGVLNLKGESHLAGVGLSPANAVMELVGRLDGWDFGAITGIPASFTRTSIAYRRDGTQVTSGTPRYETGKFSQGILLEKSVTNLYSASRSQGDSVLGTSGSTATSTPGQTDPYGGTLARRIQGSGGTTSNKAYFPSNTPASGVLQTGQVWLKNRGPNPIKLTANLSATFRSSDPNIVPADNTWRRYFWHVTGTGVSEAQIQIRAMTADGSAEDATGTVDVDVFQLQYETNSWPSTWQIGGTTRAQEQLDPPISILPDPQAEGTLEFWFTPLMPEVNFNSVIEGTQWVQLGAYAASGSFSLRMRREIGNVRPALMVLAQGSTPAGLWTKSVTVIPSTTDWYTPGVPVFIALTWINNTWKVYVDGVLKSTIDMESNPITSWANNQFRFFGADCIQSIHDDIRVSNRARTAAEIASLYGSGVPAPVDADTTYKLTGDSTLASQSWGRSVYQGGTAGFSGIGSYWLLGESKLPAEGWMGDPVNKTILGGLLLVGQSSLGSSGDTLLVPRLDLGGIATIGGTSDVLAAGVTFLDVRLLAIPLAPPYRVVIADLNGVSLDELPWSDLTYGFTLNEPGQFGCSVQLDHTKATASLIAPGQREILVYRNTQLVWGGYLWDVDASSGDNVIRLTGEGYFSRLLRRLIDSTLIFKDTEQFQIAWELIDHTQTKANGNLGITRASTKPSKTIITRRYHEWERFNVGEALKDLAERESGFDFEITPDKQWITYAEQKGAVSDVVLELGRNVDSISYTKDARPTTTELTALGAGDRRQRCIVIIEDSSERVTYGLLQDVVELPEIKSFSSLSSHATRELKLRRRPVWQPQLTVVTQEPPYGSYVLGDKVRVIADKGWMEMDQKFRLIVQNIKVEKSGREVIENRFDEALV